MTSPGDRTSRLEAGISAVVLLGLLAIAAGVILKQFDFNPAVIVATQTQTPAAASAPSSVQPATAHGIVPCPPDLVPFSESETFTPDTLYDKIDGKAELYLAADVAGMQCQRFALKDAPDHWLEWFDYDMQHLPQAFSVFSTQRRAEGAALEFIEFGYKTQNAIFFICGPHYIEIIASSTDPALMSAAMKMAAQFAADNPSSMRLTQFELLPPEHLVPGSHALQASDAFGFDQFKNVFTAQYRLDDAELTAFVISCQDANAAAALREAYRAFLLANGGHSIAPGTADSLGRIDIMGRTEIVFSEGNYVAGIHAAPTLAAGETIATALRRQIQAARTATSAPAQSATPDADSAIRVPENRPRSNQE